MRRGVAPAGSFLAALCVAWAGACANQGAPPGGPIDRRPPVVVRTEPDTFATLTDLQGVVRFHFDERISESPAGGEMDDAITVSPRTGEVRVTHGRNTLSVEVEGGFRPGLLYRITLLPVVRDMFGNQLRDPFELVVSTGGAAPPTAIAGQVWTRTTGSDASGALVHAVSADSLVHVARTDQSGIYAFRYLPDGTYQLTAFEDNDRDGELDVRETRGAVSAPVAAGDTLLLDIGMLPPDTTPAVAMSASALDSVTVALEFDDYLDEGAPASGITMALAREDGDGPGAARLLHEREYAAYVRAVIDSIVGADSLEAAIRGLALDSALAADTTATGTTTVAARPDPAAAPTDTTPSQAGPAGGAGQPGGQERLFPAVLDGGPGEGGPHPRPTRRVVAILDTPLQAEVEYQVSVSGVVNINGLTGGAGDVTVTLVRPRPQAPDSLGAGAPPAGGAAPPPPAPAAPDTTGPGRR